MAAMPLIAASPGYLPSIGPAPLRFQGSDKTAAKFVLPPLDMGAPTNGASPVNAQSHNQANSQQRPATSNDIMGLLSPPPIADSNPNSITATAISAGMGGMSAAPIDLTPNTQITAQMLVPFFSAKGATGQVNSIIIATNISFMPPAMAQPASSATYSSPNAP
jgi:hypothetical protein